MPNYFATAFINFDNVGWAEVYPLKLANTSALITQWNAIITARLPLLGTDAQIVGDRLSDSDVKGDSIPSGIVYPKPGTGGSVCFPQFDIGLRIKVTDATFIHRGNRWYRGIPTADFTGGAFVPTTGFNTALAAFEVALTGSVLCIANKIKGAIAPPFYNFIQVTQFFPPIDGKKNTGRPFGLPRGRRLVA